MDCSQLKTVFLEKKSKFCYILDSFLIVEILVLLKLLLNYFRVCDAWSLESNEFVTNLFKFRKNVVIKSILIYNNIVYGDIFLISDEKNTLISLRKLLINHQFCIYSEKFFVEGKAFLVLFLFVYFLYFLSIYGELHI